MAEVRESNKRRVASNLREIILQDCFIIRLRHIK